MPRAMPLSNTDTCRFDGRTKSKPVDELSCEEHTVAVFRCEELDQDADNGDDACDGNSAASPTVL